MDWLLSEGDSLAVSMTIATVSRCLNSVVICFKHRLLRICLGPSCSNALGCFAVRHQCTSAAPCPATESPKVISPYLQTILGTDPRGGAGEGCSAGPWRTAGAAAPATGAGLAHLVARTASTSSFFHRPAIGTRWMAPHSATRLPRETKWGGVRHFRPIQTLSGLPQPHCGPDLEVGAIGQLLRISSALPGSLYQRVARKPFCPPHLAST